MTILQVTLLVRLSMNFKEVGFINNDVDEGINSFIHNSDINMT